MQYIQITITNTNITTILSSFVYMPYFSELYSRQLTVEPMGFL